MKCVTSFVVIFALTVGLGILGAEVLSQNCIEKQLLELLSKWRSGNLSSSVPALDVIDIKSVEGVYEGFGIKITYTTGDMQLTGVNKFTVEELSVSPKKLKALTTLRFPLLTLTAEQYNLKGRAYVMYSLSGAGLMKATFEDVKVTVGTKLVSNGTVIQAKDMNLSFSVARIQVDLENSSWPINKVLNSSAMKIVESYRSEIISAAKEMLLQVINEFLATTSSSEVLSIAGQDYCNNPLPINVS